MAWTLAGAGQGSVAAEAVASATAEPAPPRSVASAGRLLYNQSCARCHGFQMVNPAPGVFDLRTFPLEDKARFIASVAAGKGAMPAWKGTLAPADVDALWNYVTSTAPR
jgi:mono/diheme cytochrome c family protein